MDLFTKGWECPKCGAVMSPTTSVCVNCRGCTEINIKTNIVTVENNGTSVQAKNYGVVDPRLYN